LPIVMQKPRCNRSFAGTLVPGVLAIGETEPVLQVQRSPAREQGDRPPAFMKTLAV
jgi:hypothetical protein